MKLPCLNPRTLLRARWVITIIIIVHFCSVASARSIYVDNTSGNDSNEGTAWNTAYKTFKMACEMSGLDGTIDKIYLAQGTYYPTGNQNSIDREATFQIKRSVGIYGGYPAGGAATADPVLYPTILSGNINNPSDKGDNSYHVVLIFGLSSGSISMDGITIQDGRADGFGTTNFIRQYWGAAVHANTNSNVSVEFSRVNFKDNYAYDRFLTTVGASVLMLGPTSKFNQCTFTGNEAGGGTAGVYIQADGGARFVNCLFAGNKAPYAAALRLLGPVELINSTVAGNWVTESPGVIFAAIGTDFKAYNSIVYNNSSGVFVGTPGTDIVRQNSLIQGITDTGNGNLNGDVNNPSFKNPVSYNSAPSNSGDYRLNDDSPCYNAADPTLLPAGVTTDLTGGPRILRGGLDMGAYETPITCYTDLYVDASRVPGGSGGSWGTAVKQLSDALSLASFCPSVTRIFVAQGTYYPGGAQNSTDRDLPFLLTRGNLKIYGGYPSGGGTRNITQYPTILSGEIGSAATNSDNSRHVLVIAGVPATGGAADADSLVLNGVTISGGNATDGGTTTFNSQAVPYDLGGGISAMGNASDKILLENVTLTNNTASRGGGMSVLSGTPVHLLRSKVVSNTAAYGGGIQNNNLSPSTVAKVISTLISGNTASQNGGGILNSNSKVSFTNSLLSGNRSVSAGAVLNYAATATFINCTIAGNLAGYAEGLGGGILDANTSKSYIYNTIVAGNNTGYFRDGSMLPEIHNSLIQGWTGTDNNNLHKDTNPDFKSPVAWQNAPTTAGDYGLLASSASIDKGDNAQLPSGISSDFNGNTRIIGSNIDMGAMEWACPNGNILYVDASVATTRNGENWSNGMKTLAEAVATAEKCGSIAEIRVAKGTYFPAPVATDQDRNKTLMIKRGGLKIIGGYPTGGGARDLAANLTILSGDIGAANDASDNVYHIMVIAGIPAEADSLVLDGFTFKLGNANGTGSFLSGGADIHRNTGGAIFLRANANGQKLTLRNCTFSGNNAQDGAGAVYVENASPRFVRCDFLSNVASNGGGMQILHASPLIVNSKFRGNSATGNGGGLLNVNSNPAIINSSFTGNLAGLGGGIYNYTGSPTITNSTIAGNKATSGNGGGFYNTASSFPVLTNSIVYGNNSELFHSSSTSAISYSLVQGLVGTGDGNLNGQTQSADFVQPLSPDSAPTIDGDYSLKSSSPGIDAANIEGLGTDVTLDLAGSTRLVGSLLDMGPYEYQTIVCVAGNELFVDANAVTMGNGGSWNTPLRTLRQALDRAKDCSNVQIIRVAKGTYYPNGLQGSTDRMATFRITRGGLKLIGGYPSGGGVRDMVAQETILSGNQGDTGSSGDNTFHVMLIGGISLSDSLVIDGFTIRDGNANVEQSYNDGPFTLSNHHGGGIYVRDLTGASLFQIRNTTLRNNYAIYGAGIAMFTVNGSPAIVNSRIISNNGHSGGGIYTEIAPLNITRSHLSQNTSAFGAAISSNGSATNISNSLLIGNAANALGNAAYISYGATLSLRNCTVAGSAVSTGRSFYVLTASLNIYNSIVYGGNETIETYIGGTLDAQGSIISGLSTTNNGNLPGDTDPLFVNAAAGDYHLAAGSPAINAGFNHLAADYVTDLDGNARIANLRVDMGAYETACTIGPAPDGASISRTITTGKNYLFNACSLIALVETAGAEPVTGQITGRNFVKDQLVTYGNARFVRRHYEVTPATNSVSATGNVTIYFSKEDFDHYNEQFGTGDNRELPVEPSDNASNLQVVKYAGSGNANGDPSSYGARTIITPTVSWNTALQLWEVMFNVTGFSGFFVTGQGPGPLPVVLTNFKAAQQEQDVVLTWETLAEKDASHFEIERSFDARTFKQIGSTPSGQPGTLIQHYSFVDNAPFVSGAATAYYRLKMVDLDQSFTYSRIISIAGDGSSDGLKIYPNPVSEGSVTLETKSGSVTGLEVYDIQGRVVPFTLRAIKNGKVTLELQNALPGTYLLRVDDHGVKLAGKFLVK